MPALQVRDFPDELYEKLKDSAEFERRSISQQTIVILQDYLDARDATLYARRQQSGVRSGSSTDETSAHTGALRVEERAKRRGRVFDLIDQLPELNVPNDFPDIVALVHEGREAR